MNWWEIFGWTGSIFVVVSLWVPSVWRFRILNLSGSLIATIYNVYFGIWPYAAMNGVIVGIDAYWMARLSRKGSTTERGYAVVPATKTDSLVQHFIQRNATDIQTIYPSFATDQLNDATMYVIMHEDEIVGIFAMRTAGTEAKIVIDYVTPRFRDLGPGRYVYGNTDIFASSNVTKVSILTKETTDPKYFAKLGFVAEQQELTRTF